MATADSIFKVWVPSWTFFGSSRAQGCSGGWGGVGGAVNVLIRAASPVEKTQRYLYILLEKARQGFTYRDEPLSFPIIYP